MLFPKKKWSDQQGTKPVCPESDLQAFMDDYLKWQGLYSLRIPDGVYRWVKMNAPQGFQKWFFGVFGGLPDNTVMIPVGGGYSVAVRIELKTADKKGRRVGKLHGKQKNNARAQQWRICTSPEQIQAAIAEAKIFSEKIRKLLTSAEPNVILRETETGG